MTLSKRLKISPARALDLFYRSNTCDALHNPETQLYTYGDAYIADEVITEMKGL